MKKYRNYVIKNREGSYCLCNRTKLDNDKIVVKCKIFKSNGINYINNCYDKLKYGSAKKLYSSIKRK